MIKLHSENNITDYLIKMMNKPEQFLLVKTLSKLIYTLLVILSCNVIYATAQEPASPANWLYPDGNPEGTLHLQKSSDHQNIDSFFVKWSSPAIYGDVQPLIGNITDNKKLSPVFSWTPNEIVAVIGNKIVVLDAAGKTAASNQFDETVYGISGVSILLDTLSQNLNINSGLGAVIGLETKEILNMNDTIAYSYIAGFNNLTKQFDILYRMGIDMRKFSPNISASIKPVFGKKDQNSFLVYAIINISKPVSKDSIPLSPPFFRGMTQ
ncbi:MAG: hypothetical protein ABSG15_02595, partial [FCB group bacterium]